MVKSCEREGIIPAEDSSFDSLWCFVLTKFENLKIEIGILPEPSEQIIILKRNSQDSRDSDDQ